MLIAQAVLRVQTPDVEEFSRRLRDLFAETGWDVAELVRRTGLSRGAVSRHLNGKAEPHYPLKVVYAQVLAKELGRTEEEILRPDRTESALTLPADLARAVRLYASYENKTPVEYLRRIIEYTAPPGFTSGRLAPTESQEKKGTALASD